MKIVSLVLLISYGWQCLFLGLSGTVSNESGDNIGGPHLVLNLRLNSHTYTTSVLSTFLNYVFEKWYMCVLTLKACLISIMCFIFLYIYEGNIANYLLKALN